MKPLRLALVCTVVAALSVLPTSLLAGTEPSPFEDFIELEILNEANDAGQIVLVQGDSVEVSFIVAQGVGLSPSDKIVLMRSDDGRVVSIKRRGNSLEGTVSLRAWRKVALGELVVRYFHDGQTVKETVPPIFVVADETIADLLLRVATLEETGGVPGPPGRGARSHRGHLEKAGWAPAVFKRRNRT